MLLIDRLHLAFQVFKPQSDFWKLEWLRSHDFDITAQDRIPPLSLLPSTNPYSFRSPNSPVFLYSDGITQGMSRCTGEVILDHFSNPELYARGGDGDHNSGLSRCAQ